MSMRQKTQSREDVETSLPEWRDYQNLVLHELERLNKNIEDLVQRQINQGLELNTIKTKAAVLGCFAGFCGSLCVVVVEYLLRMK